MNDIKKYGVSGSSYQVTIENDGEFVLRKDYEFLEQENQRLMRTADAAYDTIHYADGLNTILIDSGYHGKAEALSNRIKKYIEVKNG